MAWVSMRLRAGTRRIAAPLAIGLGLLGAAPANAQFFMFGARATVPAPAVFQNLSRAGYRMLSAIIREGDVYVVDVADPRGFRRRLVIDAYSGALVQSLGRRREAYLPPPNQYPPYPDQRMSAPPPQPYPVAPPVPRVDAGPQIQSVPSRRARTATRTPPIETRRPVPSTPRATLPAGPASAPVETRATSPAPSLATSAAPPIVAPAAVPAPAPASTARPARPAPAGGPGYANGVPINPLD